MFIELKGPQSTQTNRGGIIRPYLFFEFYAFLSVGQCFHEQHNFFLLGFGQTEVAEFDLVW